MEDNPALDTEHIHRHFSVECFNMAWRLMEAPDRTSEDDEQMIRLTQTSLWHWTQRQDCSDKNLSIGYWQTSRIYALVGEGANARKYARLCFEQTPMDEAFYAAYAYEALARAELIDHDDAKAKGYLAEAWRHAECVMDTEEKQLIVNDLKALEEEV